MRAMIGYPANGFLLWRRGSCYRLFISTFKVKRREKAVDAFAVIKVGQNTRIFLDVHDVESPVAIQFWFRKKPVKRHKHTQKNS